MDSPADACTNSTGSQNLCWLLCVSFVLLRTVKLITLQEYKAKIMAKEKIRCSWCLKDDLYKAYHDEEWGTPLHDDDQLFELLCLEGAQAGLS